MKQPDVGKAIDLLRKGDWQAAHAIVQEVKEDALSCWAHGIVHVLYRAEIGSVAAERAELAPRSRVRAGAPHLPAEADFALK